ncbi:Mce protein [Mycobacterium sp. pR1184]|uniref:Mce protein n=1 Tax=Mycobacterium sp. pR1184 TaxID=3238981 RepID=UPI00351BCA22
MAKHAGATQEELSTMEPPGTNADSSGSADESSSPPLGVTENGESPAAAPVAGTAVREGQSEELGSPTDSRDEEHDSCPGNAGDPSAKKLRSPVRMAVILGLTAFVAVGALAGWFGYRIHQSRQAQHQRDLLVQVARQGALNLTTIDYHHAEADMQRILDSATGSFYDDFSHRSKPFIEVVQKAQSTSVGTITEAGLESQSGGEAQVLVAVSVKTANLGAAEQDPRHWRMRITVQKVGNDEKVSNVVFVP